MSRNHDLQEFLAEHRTASSRRNHDPSAIGPSVENELRSRLQELERQSMLGMAAFLVLGDLLANVRLNGGVTVELIDQTFLELAADLGGNGESPPHPLARVVSIMVRGTGLETI